MKKPCLSFLALAFLSVAHADKVPDDLVLTTFSGPDITPSPACLCADAEGNVYAGIDLNGSLGKGPGMGRIVKLVDTNKDGVADSHTEFAKIDNPRGLIAVGDDVWVLYTAFGEDGASTGMNLAVLTDENRDGVADGPVEILIEGICAATQINSRGTDHSTNGIQLGIDGWIYIAVGDFGFIDATDRDGTSLTHLGGGIVRVRPDGTEMELYTTGMRNIYDVAIDPFMNVFTRGNTNDGGGWNVRFNHHIQSGEYGYPRLFINFADEIIPALADVGGGSGVGALFLDEPTWPEKYHGPLMADWGRQAVVQHRVTEDGPTFLQEAENFVNISQVSDLDVDPSGQMFLSAWNGAGFKGNDQIGYLVRVVPKAWEFEKAPDFSGDGIKELVGLIVSNSDRTRLLAQQALLAKADAASAIPMLEEKFEDESLPLAARVAALYTYAQIETDPATILSFAKDDLREFAIRAATDRLPRLEGANFLLEPFISALNDGTPRVKAAVAIALGRIGNAEAADALLAVAYEKPEAEAAKVTQLDTIKGNRAAKPELSVTPGEKLYLNLKETNKVTGPSQLAFLDPEFVLADGATISVADITPASGNVFVDTDPKGKPVVGNKKNPAKRTVVVEAPQTVVYDVPENAVTFRSRVTQAKSAPSGMSVDFFASTVAPDEASSLSPKHSTPNSAVILPHLAVRALVKMNAIDACLNAVGTSSQDLALWALSYMHDSKAVDGLLAQLDGTEGEQRQALLTTLARLYQKEAPYAGDWWWSTRPDTRGPYYKPETWEASPQVAKAMTNEVASANDDSKAFLAGLNDRMRMKIDELGTLIVAEDVEEAPTVDLAKIRAKKGAVGTTPIEDVILSLEKIKGNARKGEKLFTQQGCVACHALQNGGPSLGPFMGQIGSIMNRDQIAVAILRPNDTISQGFQTAQIKTKDGGMQIGFVTESNVDEIVLRDMTGKVTKIPAGDVVEEEHLAVSMMPPGLANALSLEEFASMVAFLASKK